MGIVTRTILFVRAVLVSRAVITAENLALGHQLGVLQRSVKHPQRRRRDRLFWAWLSRFWPSWRKSLVIVKPETVILDEAQRYAFRGATAAQRACAMRWSRDRLCYNRWRA